MLIRYAKHEDIPQISALYHYAIAALKERGIDQWQTGYPNETSAHRDIDAGLCKVCEEDGKIIATAAAYVGHEPTYDKIFEGNWLTNEENYGLIHRIAVSPDAKGRGTAGAVMAYNEEQARAAGVKSLRCDTHRDNLSMQRALKKAGYQYCGIVYIEDGTERFGFEKQIIAVCDGE